jgi:hypothetical protein
MAWEELDKDVLATLKARAKADYNIQEGTWGQMWALLQMDAEMWALVKRILEGDVANPPKKLPAPKSMGPFTNIGKIPNAVLKIFFEDIVAGHSSYVHLLNTCQHYKMKARVSSEVLAMICSTQPPGRHPACAYIHECKRNGESVDWNRVTTAFPFATDEVTLEEFTRVAIRSKILVKDPIPGLRKFLTNAIQVDIDILREEGLTPARNRVCYACLS